MDLTFDSGLVWWITAVELPLLGGLLAWLMRRDAGLARRCESRYEELSESVSEQGSRWRIFGWRWRAVMRRRFLCASRSRGCRGIYFVLRASWTTC